jgi:hypothetical protein
MCIRANGLVKNGRAEWVDDGLPTADKINAFVSEFKQNGIAATRTVYQFLDECVGHYGETSVFSEVYREHIREAFEKPALNAVIGYKNAIVYIPDGIKINPYYLCGLTNDEYVAAFRALQQLVCGIYEEIERTSPFEWGWQGWQDIASYGVWHNRIMGLLGAFAQAGDVSGDVLTIDKRKFYAHDIIKKQNQFNSKAKANLVIAGFMDMGLSIEGFDDKKSDSFTVSCPDSPNLITVLGSYFMERRMECCKCHKTDVYPCMENCDTAVDTRTRGFFAVHELLRQLGFQKMVDRGMRHIMDGFFLHAQLEQMEIGNTIQSCFGATKDCG